VTKFEYQRGDRIHAVELTDLGGDRWHARWSVREPGVSHALATDDIDLHVAPLGDGVYSVLAGHEVLEARVERDGSKRKVVFHDGAVTLEHVDPLRTVGRAPRPAGGAESISSPIPGRVVGIPVAVGEAVADGQTVIVVEAMKMANELRAAHAGRVTAIRASLGDTVEAGAALVVIASA
jgi:biotin carboxyl carrier protein